MADTVDNIEQSKKSKWAIGAEKAYKKAELSFRNMTKLFRFLLGSTMLTIAVSFLMQHRYNNSQTPVVEEYIMVLFLGFLYGVTYVGEKYDIKLTDLEENKSSLRKMKSAYVRRATDYTYQEILPTIKSKEERYNFIERLGAINEFITTRDYREDMAKVVNILTNTGELFFNEFSSMSEKAVGEIKKHVHRLVSNKELVPPEMEQTAAVTQEELDNIVKST